MNKNINILVISAYTYIKKNINYGSLFQYYALQKVMRSQNTVKWIRYVEDDNRTILTRIKSLIKKLIFPIDSLRRKKVLNSFASFIDDELETTREYYGEKDINADPPSADIYITGSDQVWGGCLPANYLTFVDKGIKASYAASFGKPSISELQRQTIRPWLESFEFISVREKTGISICEDMGLMAKQVIDPTLLLDINEYPSKEISTDSSYVLGYFLNVKGKDDIPTDRIKRFSNQNKLELKMVAGLTVNRTVFSKKSAIYLTPYEWIGVYKNCRYVFTNSFHGTVFAILCKKQFLVFLQNGKTKEQNERIYSLLELFDLTNRIYDDNRNMEEQIYAKIKWEDVEYRIENARLEAYKYLHEIEDSITTLIK